MNLLFDLADDNAIPNPERLDVDVPLLLFGFDANQRARITEFLTGDGSLGSHRLYAVGDISHCRASAIWNNAQLCGDR